MKNFISIFVVFFALVAISIAQPNNIISLFDKYSGEDGFTSLILNDASPLLKSLGGEKDAQDVLKLVKKFRILSFDPKQGKNQNKGKQFAQEVKNIKISGYEEFMSLQEGSKSLKMYYKIDSNNDNHFLMLVSDNAGESLIIYLNGSFNKKQISDLGKSLRNKK